MARFPVVQSPCPFKDNLSAIMDGDFCRSCKRTVHDLTAMSDGERDGFLAACSGEVCVKYEFPMRRALTSAAIIAAAAAMPMAAAAQDMASHDAAEYEDMMIIVGGLTHLDKVAHVEDKDDAKKPELPVVYEDEPLVKATPAG